MMWWLSISIENVNKVKKETKKLTTRDASQTLQLSLVWSSSVSAENVNRVKKETKKRDASRVLQLSSLVWLSVNAENVNKAKKETKRNLQGLETRLTCLEPCSSRF